MLIQATSQRYDHDDHVRGLVTSLLCLLPHTDDPDRGIARIRQTLAKGRLSGPYLRGLISSLGHSRASGSLALLNEFAGPGTITFSAAATEWISAVGRIGGRDAATTLLAFVQSRGAVQPHFSPHEHHLFELAAKQLASLVKADAELQAEIFALFDVPGSLEQQFALIKTVAALDSLDAMFCTLQLPIENRSHQWPYFVLEEAFRDFCLIKQTKPNGNSYTLEPTPALELRRRLLEIAIAGDRRSRNAFSLLGKIDLWRLEHGKPPREPRHPAIELGVSWPTDWLQPRPIDPK